MYSFEKIYTEFVKKYPKSNKRYVLYQNFINWLNKVCEICIPDYIWVGGSFISDKITPNDIDLVLFFNVKELEKNKNTLKFLVEKFSHLFTIHGHIAWNDLYSISRENDEVIKRKKEYWYKTFKSDSKGNFINEKIIIQVNKSEIINQMNKS